MVYCKAIRKVHFRNDSYGHIDRIAKSARELGFKFFCHNGDIYCLIKEGHELTDLHISDLEA